MFPIHAMDAIGRPRAGARVLSKVEADEVNTKTRQAFLAIGMLVSGTANTLTCKATMSVVSDGGSFEHPFLMASCMFSGEILCLVLYEASRVMSRKPAVKAVPKHIFALPAACDIIGTSIMYIGLTMTSASVYQMLRGSVIMFTGALSALYLRRRIRGYQWLAMSLVRFRACPAYAHAHASGTWHVARGPQPTAQHAFAETIRAHPTPCRSSAGCSSLVAPQ